MKMKQPSWLEELDHTADAGIVVSAGNLSELFERTAWAMFNLILDMDVVRPVEQESMAVEGSDLEDLMVRWLSELNYRHITRARVFGGFRVKEINERSLRADIQGEAIAPGRHSVFAEIKAVTYHGLSIIATDRGFQARVIFDL